MKLPSLISAACLSVFCLMTARAQSAAPTDLSQRNGAFSPTATVTPSVKLPAQDPAAVQDKRVEKTTFSLPSAAIGDRRATTEVQETREKNVREKKSSRPEATEQAVSTFNHRVAPFTTASTVAQPPVVSKYQDGLKAASATNMARFPATDAATTAKFNRFVFRKNAPESSPVTGGAPVTRAGGALREETTVKSGSPVRN